MEKQENTDHHDIREKQWLKDHILTPVQFQQLIKGKIERARRAITHSSCKQEQVSV
jgi:hypothetical protein